MTTREINVMLCAVLSTLLAIDGHWSPETPIYLALGCDFEKYSLLKQMLCTAGLCTAQSDTLTLTEKGIELARKVDEFAKI